jgi:hypothetical protein
VQVPTIDEAKDCRDAALRAWRHELGLLKFCEPHSAEWKERRKAVENARASYSKAAKAYMEILLKPDRPKQESA